MPTCNQYHDDGDENDAGAGAPSPAQPGDNEPGPDSYRVSVGPRAIIPARVTG